jgi:hypothetical protein
MTSRAALLLLLPLAFASAARAEASPSDAPAQDAVGVELDLLPAILSAADGEAGGAFQLWAGRGRNRLRLVTALVHFPDALTDAPFRDRDLTVAALVYDRSGATYRMRAVEGEVSLKVGWTQAL